MIRWVFMFVASHVSFTAIVLSGLALLSSRQDAGRSRVFGAVFWQVMALFVLVVN